MAQLDSLKELVRRTRGDVEAPLAALHDRSEKVLRACDLVERSWSGSAAGYHAFLYYRDFQEPPLHDRFSVEWGGLRGIQDGWRDRKPEEIKAHIEQLSGVSLDELEADAKQTLSPLTGLQTEVLVGLATVTFDERLQKEQALLAQVESYALLVPRAKFAKDRMPGVATRDSEAAMEGIRFPAHLAYEIIASECGSIPEAARQFLAVVDRLIRQVEAKQSSPALVSRRIFVSHGTETKALIKIERFLRGLGLEPVIIKHGPSRGLSVDDLVEREMASCDCAVILATKDDEVTGHYQPRPNVIHEIGLAQERLDGRLIYLKEEGCNFPSNISPKVWENFTQDNMEDALLKIVKELRAFRVIM